MRPQSSNFFSSTPFMQRAVITGGQGDLGTAISRCVSSEGVRAFAPGSSELDVSSGESVTAYFSNLGDVDLLVCNAGVINDKPLARMSEADWDHLIAVNLKGAFLCAREVSRSMIKRRCGHIIFISSLSAFQPPVGQLSYAAAKSALLGMMKSMARELGPRNVRVNAVLPGFLQTQMTRSLSDQARGAIRDRHVLGRFNTPEVVAEFVTHLHLKMPHTSGQVLNLDSRLI